MSKFKGGDKVRCVNNKRGAESYFTEGFVYTVSSSFADQVTLVEVAGSGWWDERFVLVQEDKFLEDAFDEPDSTPWMEAVTHHKGEKILYEYPETNFKSNPVKKSIETLVSENFNTISGKNIIAEEVVQIVKLFELLKAMEK